MFSNDTATDTTTGFHHGGNFVEITDTVTCNCNDPYIIVLNADPEPRVGVFPIVRPSLWALAAPRKLSPPRKPTRARPSAKAPWTTALRAYGGR